MIILVKQFRHYKNGRGIKMDLKMLERLCNADGVSGQEKEVTRIVKEY